MGGTSGTINVRNITAHWPVIEVPAKVDTAATLLVLPQLVALVLLCGCRPIQQRDGVPISLTLSLLSEEEIQKCKGPVLELEVRNLTGQAIRLDERCFLPPVMVQATYREGKSLSGVMPPAPMRTFDERFLLRLEAREKTVYRFALNEFLGPWSFNADVETEGQLPGDLSVTIACRYSLDSLQAIAVYSQDYPRDRGVWLGNVRSNAIAVTVARLRELWDIHMKAQGSSPDSFIRYWY